MPIDVLSVLCAQLTRDLLTIAKVLYNNNLKFTQHSVLCEYTVYGLL